MNFLSQNTTPKDFLSTDFILFFLSIGYIYFMKCGTVNSFSIVQLTHIVVFQALRTGRAHSFYSKGKMKILEKETKKYSQSFSRLSTEVPLPAVCRLPISGERERVGIRGIYYSCHKMRLHWEDNVDLTVWSFQWYECYLNGFICMLPLRIW